MSEQKTCIKCQKTKSVSRFRKNLWAKGGRVDTCISCMTPETRRRRQTAYIDEDASAAQPRLCATDYMDEWGLTPRERETARLAAENLGEVREHYEAHAGDGRTFYNKKTALTSWDGENKEWRTGVIEERHAEGHPRRWCIIATAALKLAEEDGVDLTTRPTTAHYREGAA